MKILLIIPAYNEEDNILKVKNQVEKYKDILDYIVINDGSSDTTSQICLNNNIPVVNLVNNLGIGGAVQTGYKYALDNNYDIAIQFDGDGQHDINYINKIIEPIINQEADLVIGSRFINQETSDFKSTALRRVGIKFISNLIFLLTKTKITDPTSGYRACNQKIIKLFANDYPTEYPEPESIMMIIKRNLKVKEVPVNMHERTGGFSSIHSWKSIYYMLNVSLSIIITNMQKGGKLND